MQKKAFVSALEKLSVGHIEAEKINIIAEIECTFLVRTPVYCN